MEEVTYRLRFDAALSDGLFVWAKANAAGDEEVAFRLHRVGEHGQGLYGLGGEYFLGHIGRSTSAES